MFIIILDYKNKDTPVSIDKFNETQKKTYLELCNVSSGADYLEEIFQFNPRDCHWIIIEDEELNLSLIWIENIQFLNKKLKSITLW